MKKLLLAGLAAATALVSGIPFVAAQDTGKQKGTPTMQAPRSRTSPHETVSERIGGRGGTLISITYGRPYRARGGKGEPRKICCGLVPWEKANRLGADEATLLVTPHPLEIQGKTIPAGAHTLYLVPSETGTSQLAFSSHVGKWGVPVDQTRDVARVDLNKERTGEMFEQLTIGIEPTSDTEGVIKIAWEQTMFSVPFTVKRT